jgi:hypothetical protein
MNSMDGITSMRGTFSFQSNNGKKSPSPSPIPSSTATPTSSPTPLPTSTPPTASGHPFIFYDAAETLPQISWNIDQSQGYTMWTGGTQDINNQDPRDTMTVSTNYARKGSSSYRMRVEKPTNSPPCCQWIRSEVAWLSPNQQIAQNEWRWAAVSTLIPDTFQFENRPLMIAYDTKSFPDDYPTPFGLKIINGRYSLDSYNLPPTDLGPVIKGFWEDWVLERNFRDDSTGFLRFYRNGIKVYELYGPNYRRLATDAPIPRIQHGLYKWVWATIPDSGWGEGIPLSAALAPIEIYLDEIKFGSSQNTLDDFLIK